MKPNTILFDFDGTLADTRLALLHTYRQLAIKHGFPEWPVEKLEEMRMLPILERLKKAGVPLSLLPRLVRDTRAIISDFMHHAVPYPGIPELLASLSDNSLQLCILSSNSIENIQSFLSAHGMTSLFRNVHSAKHLLGKHLAIRSFLRRHRLKKEETVYVGDELRDIAACKKVPIRIIAVSWGYDAVSLLRQGEPDAMADTPGDILSILADGFQN